jgi:integrase
VTDAVAELLEAKTKAGMSVRYLADLRSHLHRLADTFKTGIGSIHARDLEKWLDGLGGGIKTRLNARNSLIVLFGHCRAHGYLTRGLKTEAEETKRPRYKGSAPEILTPAEVETLIFGKVSPIGLKIEPTDEARLYFVLGAFSGIRTSEILRLRWEDVIFESGLIQIAADRSKTATRRLVPIAVNLRAWLAPYAAPLCGLGWRKVQKRTGTIFSRVKAENVALSYARKVLPRWPANALRHSYASYRLALIQDAGKLALEMGNTAGMVFKHYREIRTPDGQLVTADLARQWFGIVPTV